jgi:hypothetical protein
MYHHLRKFKPRVRPLALNIPSALHIRVCLIQFLLQLHSNGTSDIISSWCWFTSAFRFTVALPRPLPLLRSLSLPSPLPILCTLPFPGPLLTALLVLHTVAVIIVIDIVRTALSAARRSGIRAVVIIINFNYLIPL